MPEKFLPIGTVVMLKGGTKRLMITGFCAVTSEKQGKVFDYIGCLYPEGIISSNQTALFDHTQIDQIYALGYIDQEEKDFKKRLIETLEKNNEALKTQQSQNDNIEEII